MDVRQNHQNLVNRLKECAAWLREAQAESDKRDDPEHVVLTRGQSSNISMYLSDAAGIIESRLVRGAG
jgi:hypothetical protein